MENMLPKAWESLLNASTFLPVIVKSIERVHDNHWSMDFSQHDHFELVYMKKGSAVFHVAGEDVNISPNDMILIKPHQPHKFHVPDSRPCEFIVLSFTFVDKNRAGISQISLDDFIRFVHEKESGAFLFFKSNRNTEIAHTLNRIIRERESQEEGGEFMTYLLTMELFALLSRVLKVEWENSIRGRESKNLQLMETARAFIMEHFREDVDLSTIARYIYLSPNYFARAFKEAFDISPINYLLKLRIQEAVRLLGETDWKVGDIALQVGFSNQQRFNDLFKKHMGESPTAYRKRLKESKLNR